MEIIIFSAKFFAEGNEILKFAGGDCEKNGLLKNEVDICGQILLP